MHKFSRLREDEYLPRVSMKTLVISQTCTLTFFIYVWTAIYYLQNFTRKKLKHVGTEFCKRAVISVRYMRKVIIGVL